MRRTHDDSPSEARPIRIGMKTRLHFRNVESVSREHCPSPKPDLLGFDVRVACRLGRRLEVSPATRRPVNRRDNQRPVAAFAKNAVDAVAHCPPWPANTPSVKVRSSSEISKAGGGPFPYERRRHAHAMSLRSGPDSAATTPGQGVYRGLLQGSGALRSSAPTLPAERESCVSLSSWWSRSSPAHRPTIQPCEARCQQP